jgi:hypothetical protein
LASSGFALTNAGTLSRTIHHLRVHRVLDPQRAVLVEGGDRDPQAARTWDRLASWSSCTKSTIAFLAAPSFQEGRGSVCADACTANNNERQGSEASRRHPNDRFHIASTRKMVAARKGAALASCPLVSTSTLS